MIRNFSTFQSSALRIAYSDIFKRPVVIAASEARFIVAEQINQIKLAADILLEPERRDSAVAVAIAALHAAQHDPETVVLIMAADHVIEDQDAFALAVQKAAVGARLGFIMTLGITPSRAAVDYGYIKAGVAIQSAPEVRSVEEFIEKPVAATAGFLVELGALWNSGYFLFRADVMLAELETYAPDILSAAQSSLGAATVDLDFVRLHPAYFAQAAKISIDYAIMEQTSLAAVHPVSFDWSDVGTWDAVWQALQHDEQNNVIRGRVEIINTTNSLVYSDDELLTTVVGLDSVIVVSAADAVLVASKERSGQVKDLVALLRRKKHPEADMHRRMYRPWGWYQRIDVGDRFQVKRIVVTPGGRLSLQRHFHRAEHWVVVRGTAEVPLNGSNHLVHENEAVYLPIGSIHRLFNPGKISLELIEVQVGSYTGEDDIVRVEDVYGR